MATVLPSIRLVLLLLVAYALTGCASMTGTTNQSVSVQTRELSGKEVSGAACELTNGKGTWFVTTPGSVSIHRSNDDMQATCRKDGYDPGRAAIVSETKGSMFGNIIFGGGVGALIDHNNGSAYEYPTLIQIVMGNFTKIEPPKAPSDSVGQSTNTALVPVQAAVGQPSHSASAPVMPTPHVSQSNQPAVPPLPTQQQQSPVIALPPIILAPQQTKASPPQTAAQSAPVLLAPQASQTQLPSPLHVTQAVAPAAAKTKEARLTELKRLYDQDLVSKEAYLEQQKRILDSTQ